MVKEIIHAIFQQEIFSFTSVKEALFVTMKSLANFYEPLKAARECTQTLSFFHNDS